MSINLDAKLQAAAQILEGRVVKNDPAVEVCIKGSVFGFPAALKAIKSGWPFGVMYFLETEVVEDPNQAKRPDALKLTLSPRYGRGIWGFFTRLLLFEDSGMTVADKQLDSRFICNYNNAALAERFMKYPGVADNLLKLEHYCKFSEMQISSQAGIYMAQPKSFRALDLDVCRESFKILGQLGQVIFEAF
jgi:hypothetical protein